MSATLSKLDRNRFEVLVDGERWRVIDIAVFGKRPQLPRCDSPESFAKAFSVLEERMAKQYVLRRLAQRSYASWELRALLKKKEIDPALIDPLIEEARELGYIDDADWIASFVRVQKARKLGPSRILMKLLEKGAKEEDWEPFLDEIHDSAQEAIAKLLETRYRKVDLADYKQKQKVTASLARRGFSFQDIQAQFDK